MINNQIMKKVLELKIGNKISKILIRHMEKSDIEGIWNNFNEVVEEGTYLPVFNPVRSEFEKKSWYENIKDQKEVCLVADYLDLKPPYNILGQCEVSNSEWEASSHIGVLGVVVKKKFRDLGIGKCLVDAAIRESKKLNNKEKIVLSCFSNNDRALNLYKNMGFEVIGIRKKQFYMDANYYDEVLMDLWIDDYLRNNGDL